MDDSLSIRKKTRKQTNKQKNIGMLRMQELFFFGGGGGGGQMTVFRCDKNRCDKCLHC